MILPKGFFSQIATLVLAVAIVFTYVQPTFATISSMQDDIAVYKAEREKVVQVNSKLAQKVADLRAISPDDTRRLSTYLPDYLDEVAVQRDLVYITELSGAFFKTVGYEGQTAILEETEVDVADPTSSLEHTFTLSAEGTYSQIKSLLSLLEKNQYPLDIRSIEISPLEGGFLTLDVELTAYAFKPFGYTTKEEEELSEIDF